VNERPWLAALVYPAPLYAGLVAVAQWWGGSVLLPVGFALALGFGTLTAFGLVQQPIAVVGGRVLLALLAVLPVALESSIGSGGADLAAGVILGAPFVWLEYAWRSDSAPGARVVALETTFLLGILTIATGAARASSTGGSPGDQFFGALGGVLSAQVQGIAALLTGGVATSLPLDAAFDAVYAALAAVAMVGGLVSWFVPQTGGGEPLPWSWGAPSNPSESTEALGKSRGLRPGQREALATRTLPSPPATVMAPGFPSVLLGGVLLAGFVVLAVTVPTVTLVVLAFGVVGSVLAVALALSRRLTSDAGLEG